MESLPVKVVRWLKAFGFRFDPHEPGWGFKTAASGGYRHVFVVRVVEREHTGSVGIRSYVFWDGGSSHDQNTMVLGHDAQTIINDAIGFFREFHAWME